MTYHHLTLALAFLLTAASTVSAFGPPAKPEAKKTETAKTETPAETLETAKPDATVEAEKTDATPEKSEKPAVDFTFDYFSTVRDSNAPEKNVICSPFGASCIGEMLYRGAAGESRKALASVFHPGAAAEESPKWFRLDKDADKLPYVSVNGIWHQKDFAFLPTYTGKIREIFEPEIAEADFDGQAQAECDRINAWVAKATNQRITSLFEQLDAKTRLVLVNAICFQGRWASPFAAEKSAPGDFQCSPEKKVNAVFMNQVARFSYGETETCQYLELPYERNSCSMFLVLPKPGRSLQDAEASLTFREIDRIRGDMAVSRVELRLPKFVFNTEVDLKTVLTTLGAGVIFDATKADFSGMDGSGTLAVDQAVQKVFISVDEVGTEATAATGATVGLKSAPIKEEKPKVFHADRPFFFLIRDNVNEIPLFVGRVVDPS